jgi:hypothetical protein
MRHHFYKHIVGQLLDISLHVAKLTVETALSEDGADECQNLLEYQSKSMTCCMKDGAVSVGLMKTKQICLSLQPSFRNQ